LLILVVLAMFFAKDVLLPIVLAILISLTLSPIVRGLNRAGIPPGITAVVLVVALAISLFAVVYLVSGPVSDMLRDVPNVGNELRLKLRSLTESVEAVKEASDEVQKLTEAASGSNKAQKVVIEQPGILNYAVSSLASAGASLAIALVLAIFLLSSNDLFYAKIVNSFSRFEDKKKALRAVYDIERKVSRYLLTITIINAGLGLAIAGVLWALGVPSFYVWGLIAFLLNFLPYIGSIIGLVLVGIYTVVTIDPLSVAAIAMLGYFTCTTIEGQFVTPLILGKRLELNTVAVFVTVVFWGWLWGVAGALMAVPFLVLVKVICDNVESLGTFGNFLGSRDDGDIDQYA
jgi:predicted PurR-regulated permease PerM